MVEEEKYLQFSDKYEYIREPSQAWKSIRPKLTTFLGAIHGENKVDLLKDLYVPCNPMLYSQSHLGTTLLDISPFELEEFEKTASSAIDFGHFYVSRIQSEDNFTFTLILSPIGRGKSTFLYHQLFVELPSLFPNINWKPIVIDVKTCATHYDDYIGTLKQKINKTITESFKCFYAKSDQDMFNIHKTLCEVFQQELRNQRIVSQPADPNKNPEDFYRQDSFFKDFETNHFAEYQKKRLEYGRRKEPNVYLLLAVDNLDQHLAYPFHRQNAIIDAYSLASGIGFPLIVTLRDTSFRTNTPDEVLSSYETADYIFLEDIGIENILSIRFNKIYENLKLTDENTLGIRFISVLEKQFNTNSEELTDRSHFEKTFPWISNVTNKNKRKALESVRKALESKFITQYGHERYPAIVDERILFENGIHVKKLKRALLLGNNNYFPGDKSDVNLINMFDSSWPGWPYNNIFRVKLLQFYKKSSSEGKIIEEVVKELKLCVGNEAEHIILDNIRILIEKGLLLLYSRRTIDKTAVTLLDMPIPIERYLNSRTFLGYNGLFHIEKLLFDDLYLDEMKFSTTMPESEIDKIFKKYTFGFQPYRTSRVNSTREFINYLKIIEEENSMLDKRLDTEPIFQEVLDRFDEISEKQEYFLKDKKHFRIKEK